MVISIKKTFIILFTVFILLFLFAGSISAQEYHLVEPLPGLDRIIEGEGAFTQYLVTVFNLSIGGAAILAVLMIIIGGMQYTTAYDRPGAKQDAKERIKNALLGLLLVLVAWLLLFEINPDLVSFKLIVPEATSGTPPPPSDPSNEEVAMRDLIENICSGPFFWPNCVTINNPPCDDLFVYQAGCTSVEGISPDVLTFLQTFIDRCDAFSSATCSVTVTGGTEAGHSNEHSHGNAVDLRSNGDGAELSNFIDSVADDTGTTVGAYPLLNLDGYEIIDERTNSAPHWHVRL